MLSRTGAGKGAGGRGQPRHSRESTADERAARVRNLLDRGLNQVGKLPRTRAGERWSTGTAKGKPRVERWSERPDCLQHCFARRAWMGPSGAGVVRPRRHARGPGSGPRCRNRSRGACVQPRRHGEEARTRLGGVGRLPRYGLVGPYVAVLGDHGVAHLVAARLRLTGL
jgi:hypothetical protein